MPYRELEEDRLSLLEAVQVSSSLSSAYWCVSLENQVLSNDLQGLFISASLREADASGCPTGKHTEAKASSRLKRLNHKKRKKKRRGEEEEGGKGRDKTRWRQRNRRKIWKEEKEELGMQDKEKKRRKIGGRKGERLAG